MPRTVTLVLVDHGGTVLGALAPYEVRQPWWHSTDDIVEGARHRFGLDVTVLRLLGANRATQPGGAVTYLAQVSDDVAGWLRPGADVSGPPRPRADVNGPPRPGPTSWPRAAGRRCQPRDP
jgi:hypothetical protein